MLSRWSCGPIARRMAAVLGGVALLPLAACNQGQKDYDAALAEAEELRGQVAQLQGDLDVCYVDRDNLQRENDELIRALNEERSRQPAAPTYGASGFEGIGNVSVDRRASGEVAVGIAGDVLFDSGKATLRPQAKTTLDSVAQVLNSTYSTNTIRIEGYTDSDPIKKSGWKSNEHLSAERALAVEQYLVSKGVNTDRAYAAAFGPSNPKATKKDSRRVEIVILGS